MKVDQVLFASLLLASILLCVCRPTLEEQGPREASVYVMGSLYNAAVSHGNSKSQASTDRNESEWNNTEMISGFKHPVHGHGKEEDDDEVIMGIVHQRG